MKIDSKLIENVSKNIYDNMYKNNTDATKELIELLNKISNNTLKGWKDYIDMYNQHFYTYKNLDELINEEKKLSNGFNKRKCNSELNKSIWELPCGLVVQYVVCKIN